MLYASDIRRALKNNRETREYFVDVVAGDLLPNRRNQRGIYVVNTHPHDKPGEHWTIVEYTPTTVIYFDPYGGPPHPTIMKHLRRTKALRGKRLLYAAIRRQGYRHTCGFYCIYYVLTRTNGQYDMNIFNSDLDFNDRMVQRIVTRRFNVNKRF